MIPAYNEEETLGSVIKEIPRQIQGIDEVKVLVINDGSKDRTAEVSKEVGADYVVSHNRNKGLAQTFKTGLEEALFQGADIIVNTDADGQYDGNEIPKLIDPILKNEADIVLGDRQVKTLEHMPFGKKMGNRISSWVVRRASGLPIKDAQTGFRAFSREAALRMNIVSEYTYTQETIIQAAYKKLKIAQIPIIFRKRPGKSRLISGIWNYAKKSGLTIIRTYRDYKPLKIFWNSWRNYILGWDDFRSKNSYSLY